MSNCSNWHFLINISTGLRNVFVTKSTSVQPCIACDLTPEQHHVKVYNIFCQQALYHSNFISRINISDKRGVRCCNAETKEQSKGQFTLKICYTTLTLSCLPRFQAFTRMTQVGVRPTETVRGVLLKVNETVNVHIATHV